MTTTSNILLTQPAYGSNTPTWDVPLNYNSTILDYMFSATTSVTVSASGSPTYTNVTAPNATPTANTSQCMRILLTGTLNANQTVLLPYNISGFWIVSNTTTGSYTVTIASNNGSNLPTGGTTVNAPQGQSILIYSNATDVNAITAGGTVAVANGGTGQTSYTDGQLLIGNSTGNTLTKASLTAGSGISITPGPGSITIAATGSGGSVTSVGLSAPALFTVTNSPVTTAGTLTLSYSGTALPAANGGTGLTSPGANGNVLTSNGTAWVSSAPSGGGVSSFSAGTTGLLPSSATTGAVTLSGTLGVTNGGTGNSIAPTNGQILIGNGTTYVRNTLTAGTGISIANGAGTISVTNSGVTSAVAGTGVTLSSGTGAVTVSIGQSVATTASPSFAAITASTGNISASAGSITANTNVTATTGDVKATNGKVIAGNNGHYLNSGGTGTATTRIWQVSTTASGDSTNTSIYWDNSALKYFFNPSGTNGVLTLTNAEFVCNVTPKANQTSWTLISDRTEKRDISPVTNAVQRIMALNPVNFTWIKTEKADSGFIAQEFETVYPNNVQTVEDGKKAIAINMNIYADLVSTIQILQNKITDLEARLAANNM